MKKKKAPVAAPAPVMAEVVPDQKFVVNCPKCGTLLTVKGGNFAHLCPVCSQVFRIRTGEKLVKDVTRKMMVEAYVNIDKDPAGIVHTNSVINEAMDD